MSKIKLKGSSSGEAEVTVAAAAGTPTFTLPTTVGSANQLLKNSGTAGTLEYSSIVDSSGNVGIGTTPETDGQANSLYFANGNANIWGSGNVNLYTVVNARYTGTAWKYNNTAPASYVGQQSGVWNFFNAPSGTADAAATFTERLRIKADGHVSIISGNLEFASGAGIDFSNVSDGSRSISTDGNKFQDYEEGTWTPTLTNATISQTHSATYTKIGNVVYVQSYIYTNSGSGSSGISISGLPYPISSASSNARYSYGSGRLGNGGVNNAQNDIVWQFEPGNNTVTPLVADGGINWGFISSTHVIFSGFYFT